MIFILFIKLYIMYWSKFTLNNYKQIYYYKLKNNNLLINKMEYDKKNILNMEDIKFEIEYCKIDNELITEYSTGIFVYTDGILNNLKSLKTEIKITWKNNEIYIKCSDNKLKKILNRLHILLKVINYINKNNDKIIMYLILTDLKKHYDPNDKIFNAKHINSGYTYIVPNKEYIFIWREEEFEKLIFHELIHLFNFDHRYENYDLNKNLIEKKNIYESLTDLKGIYYNIIYLSILSNENIDKLLNIEINFMINQCKLIYDKLKNNYKENNNVYSYYIIKPKLFIYLLSDMNDELYENIFINNIFGNEMVNIVNNITISDNNVIDFNSCRMTILELN